MRQKLRKKKKMTDTEKESIQTKNKKNNIDKISQSEPHHHITFAALINRRRFTQEITQEMNDGSNTEALK